MRVVLFLQAFLACGVKIMAPDGNNIVTAVGRRVIDRFVFAHEEERNGRGEAAERTGVGADINVMPCSRVGKTSL